MTTTSKDTTGKAADPKRSTSAIRAQPADPAPTADAAAAGSASAPGFTVLPSLQRVASGPVCENGVCYVPGAEPVKSDAGSQPKP